MSNGALKQAWMRVLEVDLVSTTLNKKISFGNKWRTDPLANELNIKVTGYKYLSSMKDNCTITITNLTYNEVIEIIEGKYYKVSVRAGYRKGNISEIFSGYVIYISNNMVNRQSNNIIIICGNYLVAQYGQTKLNLTLSSGINMYSAIEFILKRAGIRNYKIDSDFKDRIISEVTTVENESIASWLQNFTSSYNFSVSGDSSDSGEVATIVSLYRTNNRLVKLNSDRIVLVNGYPTLTSEGLNMTLLPTFNFKPLDVVQLDNSVIDISVSRYSNASDFNVASFLDSEGKYVIYQVDYSLSNREDSFNMTLYAKARSLYSYLTSS